MKVFGLKSCDTCRRALKELRSDGYDPQFVDVRADGVGASDLARFLDIFGEKLVNRRSTTWRGLSETERAGDAGVLLARYPTLMKRPVIEKGAQLWLGWGDDVRAAIIP